MFTTLFQLRSKNASGNVLATFKEAPGVGRHVSLPSGQAVWLEREGLDFSDQSYYLGCRQVVVVDFLAEDLLISGDSGFSSMQAVLNALPAGGSLEYSLDGGTTWVPCRHDDPEISKPGNERNVASKITLTLTSRAIVASPLRTS
jgi:hypothetical protein